MSLLHWAWHPSDICTVATWRIADYANVSVPTVERALAKLEKVGLIARDRKPYTANNMTGRAIRLLWVADPSRIVPPPSRDAPKGKTRVEPCNDPSPLMSPQETPADTVQINITHQGRWGGAIKGDGEGPSRAMDKLEQKEQPRRRLTICTDSSSSPECFWIEEEESALIQAKSEPDPIASPPPAVPPSPTPTEPATISPLAPALDRVLTEVQAHHDQPEPKATDPARKALIDSIEHISQGDREVRKSIMESVPNLLKKLKLAGSESPHDHTRMALEKSASSKTRRDTIESLARGIIKNWIIEGLPGVHAPIPPGRLKQQATQVRDLLQAREAEAKATEEADAVRQVIWDAIPEAEKERLRAEARRSHPHLARFPKLIEANCINGFIE